MVLYEVALQLQPSIAAAYRDWLAGHIQEILALDGFASAEVFEDAPAEDGAVRLAVHYRLRDRAALDRYLAGDAARLRADAVTRFGDGFTATRRVLQRVQAYGA